MYSTLQRSLKYQKYDVHNNLVNFHWPLTDIRHTIHVIVVLWHDEHWAAIDEFERLLHDLHKTATSEHKSHRNNMIGTKLSHLYMWYTEMTRLAPNCRTCTCDTHFVQSHRRLDINNMSFTQPVWRSLLCCCRSKSEEWSAQVPYLQDLFCWASMSYTIRLTWLLNVFFYCVAIPTSDRANST